MAWQSDNYATLIFEVRCSWRLAFLPASDKKRNLDSRWRSGAGLIEQWETNCCTNMYTHIVTFKSTSTFKFIAFKFIWLVVWTPLKNIESIGMIIPNIWENKKCSKPPTSYICIYIYINICKSVCLYLDSNIEPPCGSNPTPQSPTGRVVGMGFRVGKWRSHHWCT